MNGFELRQHAHLLSHFIACAKEIDHVAIVSQSGRTLDNNRLVPSAFEAPGQGQAGDSRTTDENSHEG